MHSLAGPLPHLLLEMLAYAVAGRIYWRQSATLPHPAGMDRWLLLGGAVFGAMVGSKLLHIAEHWPALVEGHNARLWIGGKSVLGGFMGGTLGVELAKGAIGWDRSTGDPWVPALTAGLLIGRAGCQLSGTWDQTYGVPTGASWGWDYGDGVLRHPVALYELVLVLVLYAAIRTRWRASPGARFAAFMLGYAAIRFGLEWFKPPFGELAPGSLPVALYGGLTAIQWAALLAVAWFGALFRHRRDTAAFASQTA